MARITFLHRLAAGAVALSFGVLFSLSQAVAADVPSATEASPDVYKVLSETPELRVVEATWAPGQRDVFHSHPGIRASYYVNDCKLRIFTPDGKQREGFPKRGKSRTFSGKPVKSHSVQNIGDTVCKVIIVEMK